MPFLPPTSSGVIVQPGDFVEIRYPTPSTWDTDITFQVQIGEGIDDVTIGTKIPDAQPDFFIFNDQLGRTTPTSGAFGSVFEKNTVYYSNAIQVSGIELRVPIRISSSGSGPRGTYPNLSQAAFSVNDGPYITEANSFFPVTITATLDSTSITVTSGNIGDFAVGMYIATPRATGEILSIVGNVITLTEPASSSGSSSGNGYFTVQAGNTVRLRIQTEDWYTTNTNVTLTISDNYWDDGSQTNGQISDTWSITTRAQQQVVTTLSNGTFVDYIDQRDFDFGTYKTATFPIVGIDDDAIVEATSTGDIEISTDGNTWVQNIQNLTLGDSIEARTLIGVDYTTLTQGTLTIFANAGQTLPGGFENNTPGTFGADQGNGNFEVTQVIGTTTDDQQIWTEVDRYPDPISLSPVFTYSDNFVLTLAGTGGQGFILNAVYNTSNFTTPAATGLTVRATQVGAGAGELLAVEIVERGSGYQDLDQIQIIGGSVPALYDLQQYRKVTVSTTNVVPNAEPNRDYYVDVPISGLGVEYLDGAYNLLEEPLAGDDGNPALPIDTSAVNGQNVQIQAVVLSGAMDLRKNDTGTWSTGVFVENGDVLNVRLRSGTNFNQTVVSSFEFQGPASAGPLGNPTLGPVFNVPSDITDTLTLTTRAPRYVPERFKAPLQIVDTPGQLIVAQIPLAGLDANTTISVVSSTPFSNAGVSSQAAGPFTSSALLTPVLPFAYVGIEAGDPGDIVEVTYQIGFAGDTVQDKFVVLTEKEDYTYITRLGGTDTTVFAAQWADLIDVYVYGAGGGDGGQDAPNSYAGQGAPGNFVTGTLNLPPSAWPDPINRRLNVVVGERGLDGADFSNNAAGGAGGFGYGLGGAGGAGANNEFSGGGGGGGGASAINLLDALGNTVVDTLIIAGGGGGGGGAGGDTTPPEDDQQGNRGLGGGTLSGTDVVNVAGLDGETNTVKGGGGGGAGGGFGAGGLTNTQKFDSFGGLIGTTDLDAQGGQGGGWYYDPALLTVDNSFLGQSEVGSAPQTDGLVILAWPPQDTVPDPFSFTPAGPVDPFTTVESEIVQITGITGFVNFSITTNGSSAEMRSASDPVTLLSEPWGPGTVLQNNDYLQIRMTTGALYNISYNAIVTPGTGSNVVWFVSNGEAPDTTPTPFIFTDVTGAPISTLIESNQVDIGGINQTVDVTATNGAEVRVGTETPVGSGIYVYGPYQQSPQLSPTVTVSNGQRLQVRILSSAAYLNTVSTSVVVGNSGSVIWNVTTEAEPDLNPDVLSFVPLVNQPPLTEVFSNIQDIQNISQPVDLTVTNGALIELNGVQTGLSTIQVAEFDVIRLYYTTSAIAGETVNFGVTAGLNNEVFWSVSNAGSFGTTPDPFTFGSVTTPLAGDPTESVLTVTISGITDPNGVSIYTDENSGIQLEIIPPAGSFTGNYQSYAGLASDFFPAFDGYQIRARLTSPLFPGFSRVGTVYIGDGVGTFTVFTAPPVQEPILGQWYSSLNVIIRSGVDPNVSYAKYPTKFDGLPVGSIMPVFKENVNQDSSGFGDLDDGTVGPPSRFPGFIYCYGQLLDPVDYPVLFSVIGYTYGQDIFNRFRVPDMRNKKVVGTGPIDGTRASSPILAPDFGPTKSTTGRSAFNPGSHGGIWFIDTINSPSDQVIPQVEDAAGDSPDVDSQFFDIASIRTSGYTDVTSVVEFITTGSSRGDISLKETRLFEVPFHVHELMTGVADVPTKGRVYWNGNGGYENDLPTTSFIGDSQPQNPEYATFLNLWGFAITDGITLQEDDAVDTSTGDGVWTREVEAWSPSFCAGIVLVQGAGYDGDHITQEWNSIDYRQIGLEPGGANYNEINSFIDVDNTPFPGVSSGGSTFKWIAAIDIPSRIVSIDQFRPAERASHNHYLTRESVTGIIDKFSYGNNSGPGVVYDTTPSTESIEILFDALDIGLEVLPGTFTLDQNKQIIPTPSLQPQQQVGLITPYVWAKWMIKAY